ncbi:DUF2975 domain-containing protein [Aliarcobacter butzleri]|uniref:DUF2975 domain-containing protein n=1 Tax=Aliarcobacter butzleri TaxID=28197 RepID=UPI0021B44199|nr:DUF2975 domain-containing protein [Aliarcobacter butzleri]MCT7616506.1 DUF2975 domain-containing protein [Aliarcobacter butzleri]
MDNITSIKKLSKFLNFFISVGVVFVPIYYIFYWSYLSSSFIDINNDLISLVKLQLIGFFFSLFPLFTLSYTLLLLKKLLNYYENGNIFTIEQVLIFKKIAKYLTLWATLSIGYESIKSVIFSINNIEGNRVFILTVESYQVILLVVSVIILLLAKIVSEGNRLNEENKFII